MSGPVGENGRPILVPPAAPVLTGYRGTVRECGKRFPEVIVSPQASNTVLRIGNIFVRLLSATPAGFSCSRWLGRLGRDPAEIERTGRFGIGTARHSRRKLL